MNNKKPKPDTRAGKEKMESKRYLRRVEREVKNAIVEYKDKGKDEEEKDENR